MYYIVIFIFFFTFTLFLIALLPSLFSISTCTCWVGVATKSISEDSEMMFGSEETLQRLHSRRCLQTHGRFLPELIGRTTVRLTGVVTSQGEIPHQQKPNDLVAFKSSRTSSLLLICQTLSIAPACALPSKTVGCVQGEKKKTQRDPYNRRQILPQLPCVS